MDRRRRKQPKKIDENIIFGFHPVMEAMQAGQPVDKLLIRKGMQPDRASRIRTLAKESNAQVQVVPDEKLQRLVGDVNHQGVVAMLSLVDYHELETLIQDIKTFDKVPLLLMLDGITDVRNFGAIARTAECMGAQGIIIPLEGAAPISPVAIKTSAGALSYLPICREKNLVDSLLMLNSYGIQSVASTEKANDSFFELDLSQPTCIIMGSEDKGISSSLLKRVDKLAKIPLAGRVQSLNVSVAAGMVLSEAVRQRSAK
ncbi:MAG: 23S rRNA (guanosine(2251)-2'-O)-methyltransferase RlmB [Bacteroidia bacterium]|nr:23S rRNA (guanosine(2251)-2'-O)-methyltransferase RlmB [Bacteroidia bacterium]